MSNVVKFGKMFFDDDYNCLREVGDYDSQHGGWDCFPVVDPFKKTCTNRGVRNLTAVEINIKR